MNEPHQPAQPQPEPHLIPMLRTPEIPRDERAEPQQSAVEPQNEPRTCPYCDQPRQDTFENRWRFECGTSLQQSDGKTVKQGSECKLRVVYSKLLVDWCKQKERIAELEKGIAEIQAGTRIGWFMTDLGAKCSKLLNQ